MEFNEMVGKTLESIEGGDIGSERITFNFADGTAAASYHSQDCCESVKVTGVLGDIENIIGAPIIAASEVCESEGEPKPEYPDSWTWTRQRIQTEKGEALFTWLGESNGYYGETPYFQITHGRTT